ncbi:MAG: efflux RND transporter permease subunit, partial [Cyanothece sp. SIO2G6]|nr:efflux RND transporter permease subunit [Cyanothece sp. SIO2G6]
MNLSAGSIHKPIPTLVLFLVLILLGVLAFIQLEIDEDPNIDIPAAFVSVQQIGAGPTELETQVTRKVEDALAGLDNVDELNSSIQDGRSTTLISFLLGTDTDRAVNDVRNAIAQIRQDLPADINEPIVERGEFIGRAVISYVVASDRRSVDELSDWVDRVIGPALLKVPGVAQIDRGGGVDREIRVNLSPDRLLAYGITASQVNNQIRAWNADLPAGEFEVAGNNRNVRTLGSAATVADLRQYQIVLPNGSSIPLNSLGTIEDSFAEIRQEAWFSTRQADGVGVLNQSVVTFSAMRSTGSSVVAVEKGVKAAVQDLQLLLPQDVQLEMIFTRADDIRASYQATLAALVLGSFLTVVVVACFLRDWRPTLITATALPLSIIPTFLVMRWLGYTLNSMTLLALALAMGNLVDDAICMIENIDQHLRQGKPPFQAALDASQEIGLAVIATTATIVGVFLPVAFMGGIPGQFFQPFGITVAVATMFSTLVAITLTPMLAAYLLQPKARPILCGDSDLN